MLLAANTFTMPYDQVHSAHEHKSKSVAVLMKIDNFIVDKSACVTVGRHQSCKGVSNTQYYDHFASSYPPLLFQISCCEV